MRISDWSSDVCSSDLHCSKSGHLRNEAMASHHPLIGIIDVCGIVIEGGERTYHTTHDRHRMSVATETTIEGRKLLMHHGMARNGRSEERRDGKECVRKCRSRGTRDE